MEVPVTNDSATQESVSDLLDSNCYSIQCTIIGVVFYSDNFVIIASLLLLQQLPVNGPELKQANILKNDHHLFQCFH